MRMLLLAAIITAGCLTATAGVCQGIGAEPWGASVIGLPTQVGAPSVWSYTVVNTSSDAAYTLWMVAIEVDEAADVLSATSPAGWMADYLSQPHFVSWICVSKDIPAGTSKTGFTATFSGTPAYQTYSANFNNSDTGEAPSTFGVVSVPEPAGIAALLCGLAPLAGLARRRRS